MFKKFVVKTFAFVVAIVSLFSVAFALLPAGRIGDVYARVSSPKQESLVIGTSRAAQAVNPQIINSELHDLYPSDLYNYAFHIDASTFNIIYEKAIYSKLADHDGRRHLFIIAVDPWALRQLDSIPQELNLWSYSSRPNMDHLLKNFSRSWFSPLPTHSFVNEHGRTEVDYVPKSKSEWEARVKALLTRYDPLAKKYDYSDEAEQIAKNIINNLKKRGDVILVRIPVSVPMLTLEDKVCPDFNHRMNRLAEITDVKYFNFTHHNFQTTDGNHLTLQEGNRFSATLADSIRKFHK